MEENMGTLKSGALLPAGTGEQIEPIMVEDYKSIQQVIGGCFDVVRKELEDGTVICGYVHDEGLLLGMDTNWFASALFERHLVGPCVVVSGTSPSGEYDGDDYDLPERFFHFLANQFAEHVIECYNESMLITVGIELAKLHGIIDDDDLADLDAILEQVVDLGGERAPLTEWMDDLGNKVQEFNTVRKAEILVDEVEEFLKKEGQ
jgi:hypothetical protein